jgi:hypothetical protein
MESGATMRLNSWSVSFAELTAIPGPASTLALATLLASAMCLRSRRRKPTACDSKTSPAFIFVGKLSLQ